MLCPQELTIAVAAAANALYERLSDKELAVLAAVFTQLGDTLITLAAQKALLERCCEKKEC